MNSVTRSFGASIVAYKNSVSEIKNVVRCLLDSSLSIKVYIVDNSPTDFLGSQFYHERIEYIFNNSNIGYGAGHNIALKKSIDAGYKYHVVLNPDISFIGNDLQQLFNYMEKNPDVGLLMPKVLYPDGSIQFLCKLLPTPFDWIFRRFLPFKKLRQKKNSLFELHFSGYDRIMNIPYLSGVFMFFRLKAIEEVGFFDEGIFMYGEDTDITRRIYNKYKTIFYPEVNIIHEHQKRSYKSLRLLWIHIKAAIYYFNKWGWFFDQERKKVNKKVLTDLGYYDKQ